MKARCLGRKPFSCQCGLKESFCMVSLSCVAMTKNSVFGSIYRDEYTHTHFFFLGSLQQMLLSFEFSNLKSPTCVNVIWTVTFFLVSCFVVEASGEALRVSVAVCAEAACAFTGMQLKLWNYASEKSNFCLGSMLSSQDMQFTPFLGSWKSPHILSHKPRLDQGQQHTSSPPFPELFWLQQHLSVPQ